jgi:hypothetical protein
MTEREATADERVKHWNRLTSTWNPFHLDSIRIINSNVFVPQLIKFDRVTALVGVHGSGKSLMLRVLEAVFGHASQPYAPPLLPDEYGPRSNTPQLTGLAEVCLQTPAGCVERTIDLNQSGKQRRAMWQQEVHDSFDAMYADPISAFSWLDYMLNDYDFTAKPKETDKEYIFKAVDLRAFQNILGRTYDHATLRSPLIEDGNDDGLRLPAIRTTVGPKIFDNASMSHAELWVHYVNWFLNEDMERGWLALLDEPETFIAARGRRPFIDYVAYQALRNDLQLIIGTHSGEMLSRFPLGNIRMCIPGDDGIRIITPKSMFQIREAIGLDTPVSCVTLVEDQLAREVLTAVFAKYDTALTREVDIVAVDGASNVRTSLRSLKPAERLVFIGVLDGDERTKTKGNYTEPIFFLPGEKAPEEELLEHGVLHAARLAIAINSRPEDIIVAINSCRDLDHQYQIGAAARLLGCSGGSLTFLLIREWLRYPKIAKQAARLADDIRKRMSSSTGKLSC